jgi:Zn finger protein HypA/HybF involved in hydrogenase expression
MVISRNNIIFKGGKIMSRRVTTEDFIKHAREVHGNRYDYSKVMYVAAICRVVIICPQHGEFEQRPVNHLIGRGCHECGGNKPLTLDRFIERVSKIHSGRYDYSRVKFNNVECKIEIICTKHGPFFQQLMSHLKGFNCPQCGQVSKAKKLSHSLQRFLDDAKKAHGDKYDYSWVRYINALTNVTIICPNHGHFDQKPANHIRDVGCPKCGDESAALIRTRTTGEFVQEAKEVHGDLYDYSKVEYESSHEKVEIGCLVHGAFLQTPANHISNRAGCPGCALSGFDQTKPGLLYYIAVKTNDNKMLYKIGITNLSIERRFPAADRARIRVVKIWRFEVGQHAAEREAVIISQFARYKYYGSTILVGSGNTELFTKDVLGLDKKCHEPSHAVVDSEANLISRPIQLNFDFYEL